MTAREDIHQKTSCLSRMRGTSLRTITMSVAACLVVVYAFGLFLEASQSSSSQVDWKGTFFDEEPLTEILEKDLKTAKDSVEEIKTDLLGTKLFGRECNPKNYDGSQKTILLLHGAAFKSETWLERVPTMQTMCALGHRVVAVDLPGHGNTGPCKTSECEDKAEYLREVVMKVTGDVKPVIVSPSFSGSYSLPFLVKYQGLAGGFVPVAPVGTSNFQSFLKNSMSVPTLIVYGEMDYSLGRTSAAHLKTISTASQPIILSGARHPAYLDQPDKWHQVLHNFVSKIP